MARISREAIVDNDSSSFSEEIELDEGFLCEELCGIMRVEIQGCKFVSLSLYCCQCIILFLYKLITRDSFEIIYV